MNEKMTMLIEKDEYEELVRNYRDLEFIRRAVLECMSLYRADGDPYFKDGLITVLKIVFPVDFEYRLRELRAAKKKEADESQIQEIQAAIKKGAEE